MSLLQIGKRKKAASRQRDRIYISASSEGYGHSSRAIAIASQFSNEEVLIGTYSYAFERLKTLGIPCVPVSQEIKFIGTQGQFDVSKTIFQNPARALGFNQIVQEEMDVIQRHGISLVLADGRMAPVLAASRLNIPCLVLTNQSAFYPFFERESDLVKLFGRSFEWVMKLWLSSAEEILIPDFPPPDTVCLPNLSDNYQVKKRTRFVGPLVAWKRGDITPIPRANTERPLIILSTGGHDYRHPMLKATARVAQDLPEIDFIAVTPFTMASPPPNLQLIGQVRSCESYFAAADAIITQAGHSTAMEILTLGKPAVIIPDSNQIEQENNARRMVELGVACQVTYEQLKDPNQQALKQAVLAVISRPEYKHHSQTLSDKAEAFHGASYTAGVLREYAHRLLAY